MVRRLSSAADLLYRALVSRAARQASVSFASLARELRWPLPSVYGTTLDLLEDGLVECWGAEGRGEYLILSPLAASRERLRLADDGERWESLDRPEKRHRPSHERSWIANATDLEAAGFYKESRLDEKADEDAADPLAVGFDEEYEEDPLAPDFEEDQKRKAEGKCPKKEERPHDDLGWSRPRVLLGTSIAWPARRSEPARRQKLNAWFGRAMRRVDRRRWLVWRSPLAFDLPYVGPCPVCKGRQLPREWYCLCCDNWGVVLVRETRPAPRRRRARPGRRG